MNRDGAHPHLVVREDPRVHGRLDQLVLGSRMVFFAGLPRTGKSLLIHQLAHLAHAAGRTIHLLQWDVARPRFEASAAGRRYPMLDGVTHIVIRKAVGVWARHALVRWHADCPDPKPLLIGETPLVGHRLIELARRMDDEAEPLLTAASCQFVIPVPSRDVAIPPRPSGCVPTPPWPWPRWHDGSARPPPSASTRSVARIVPSAAVARRIASGILVPPRRQK